MLIAAWTAIQLLIVGLARIGDHPTSEWAGLLFLAWLASYLLLIPAAMLASVAGVRRGGTGWIRGAMAAAVVVVGAGLELSASHALATAPTTGAHIKTANTGLMCVIAVSVTVLASVALGVRGSGG